LDENHQKLTTFVVPPRWLFLKIETDEAFTGWGSLVEGRAETVAAVLPSWRIIWPVKILPPSRIIGQAVSRWLLPRRAFT